MLLALQHDNILRYDSENTTKVANDCFLHVLVEYIKNNFKLFYKTHVFEPTDFSLAMFGAIPGVDSYSRHFGAINE